MLCHDFLTSKLKDLPWYHSDPFDRIRVAQAKEMGLTVVTRDPSFALYEVDVLWDVTPRRNVRRR